MSIGGRRHQQTNNNMLIRKTPPFWSSHILGNTMYSRVLATATALKIAEHWRNSELQQNNRSHGSWQNRERIQKQLQGHNRPLSNFPPCCIQRVVVSRRMVRLLGVSCQKTCGEWRDLSQLWQDLIGTLCASSFESLVICVILICTPFEVRSISLVSCKLHPVSSVPVHFSKVKPSYSAYHSANFSLFKKAMWATFKTLLTFYYTGDS